MTLYNIIATKNTPIEDHIHTMVSCHSIQKTLEDAFHYVNLMAEAQNYETPIKTWDKDGYIVFEAKFTTSDNRQGWVEYEIWKYEI